MWVQLVVSHDACLRECCFKACKEAVQAGALLRCPRIGRAAIVVQSAFVADADGIAVEAAGMRPHLAEGAPRVDLSVACNVVVVADVGKAPVTVVATAVVHGVSTVGAGGTTMDYNQTDRSHAASLFTDRQRRQSHRQWPMPRQ